MPSKVVMYDRLRPIRLRYETYSLSPFVPYRKKFCWSSLNSYHGTSRSIS